MRMQSPTQFFRQHAGLAIGAIVVGMGCAKQAATPMPAPRPAPSPAAQVPAPPPPQIPVMPDSIQALNDKYVARITAAIAGKENLPAEQVFKDIQLLKGQSASRLLAIMNVGYSKALGVSCERCHNPTDFASNEMPDKKQARGMIRMVNMTNESNKTIPEFAGNGVTINCVMCHRGARRPVSRLPGQGGPPRGPGGAPAPVRED